MTEAVSSNRESGSGALRPRFAVFERVSLRLGISFAVSVAITFALLFAFSAAGHRSPEALGLRGTISD